MFGKLGIAICSKTVGKRNDSGKNNSKMQNNKRTIWFEMHKKFVFFRNGIGKL